MAPTIPVAATDVSGTGTTLAGAGEAETSGTSDKVLGIAVLPIEVILVSSGGERRRVTSSATRATNSSNNPGGRERGCGSTEAALEMVDELFALRPEDEPWLSGVCCEPARLDFRLGGSAPAAIATACAEGVRKRFDRFGGILSLESNREKTHQIMPKQNNDNEIERIKSTSQRKKPR